MVKNDITQQPFLQCNDAQMMKKGVEAMYTKRKKKHQTLFLNCAKDGWAVDKYCMVVVRDNDSEWLVVCIIM